MTRARTLAMSSESWTGSPSSRCVHEYEDGQIEVRYGGSFSPAGPSSTRTLACSPEPSSPTRGSTPRSLGAVEELRAMLRAV